MLSHHEALIRALMYWGRAAAQGYSAAQVSNFKVSGVDYGLCYYFEMYRATYKDRQFPKLIHLRSMSLLGNSLSSFLV